MEAVAGTRSSNDARICGYGLCTIGAILVETAPPSRLVSAVACDLKIRIVGIRAYLRILVASIVCGNNVLGQW